MKYLVCRTESADTAPTDRSLTAEGDTPRLAVNRLLAEQGVLPQPHSDVWLYLAEDEPWNKWSTGLPASSTVFRITLEPKRKHAS